MNGADFWRELGGRFRALQRKDSFAVYVHWLPGSSPHWRLHHSDPSFQQYARLAAAKLGGADSSAAWLFWMDHMRAHSHEFDDRVKAMAYLTGVEVLSANYCEQLAVESEIVRLNVSIGALIDGYRRESGLTMEQLAHKAGVNKSTVQSTIQNRTTPHASSLKAIVGALSAALDRPITLDLDSNPSQTHPKPD
jgi:DNA-binding XRE family transcriptional regulator